MRIKSIAGWALVSALLISFIMHGILKINYKSELIFQAQKVFITRDINNIPEIHAPSFRSAMYAWGYVTAEDRIFQLAFRRASVRGELSKYLGVKALEVDKMFRQLNLAGWGKLSADKIEEFKDFQAYAQGINSFYNQLKYKPIQFYLVGMDWSPWTVADIFSVYKLVKWSLSTGMVEEYIRSSLLKKFTKQQVDLFLPYDAQFWMEGEEKFHTTIIKDSQIPNDMKGKNASKHTSPQSYVSVGEMNEIGFFDFLDVNSRASNSWVISGNHTQSGHALLCNDPHLDSTLPGQWHQIRIFYPGEKGQELFLIGGAIIGLPTIVGKTSYLSITLTVNYLDTQDLFKETVEAEKYLLDGQWKPLKKRLEIIEIKNQQPIQYIVYESHRGPIIRFMSARGYLYKIQDPVSLCWIGFTDKQYLTLSPFIRIAQYQTYHEAVTFLKEISDYAPSFNILYFTKDDHIGYQAAGAVPIRANANDGNYIKDGSNSQNDWKGFIKGNNKLNVQDPDKGYIVSANNKAAGKEYYGGVLDMTIFTARATRIEQLIESQIVAGKKLNLEKMRQIQLDTVDSYCQYIVQKLKGKLSGRSKQLYQFPYGIFEGFDCDFRSSSTTASFYLVFLQNLYQELHPLGIQSPIQFNNVPHFYQYIYSFILKNHTEDELRTLNQSMFDTLSELREYFQSNNPSDFIYGDIHKDYMQHRPFSFFKPLQPFVQHLEKGWGNMNTPNIAYMYKMGQKDYRTFHRANIRLIMSYHEDSFWIVDGGTSQKWYSKYYMDQTQSFVGGKYLVMDRANRTFTFN